MTSRGTGTDSKLLEAAQASMDKLHKQIKKVYKKAKHCQRSHPSSKGCSTALRQEIDKGELSPTRKEWEKTCKPTGLETMPAEEVFSVEGEEGLFLFYKVDFPIRCFHLLDPFNYRPTPTVLGKGIRRTKGCLHLATCQWVTIHDSGRRNFREAERSDQTQVSLTHDKWIQPCHESLNKALFLQSVLEVLLLSLGHSFIDRISLLDE